jgi:heptosyltransferase-1
LIDSARILLVLRLSALGDVIHTIPAVLALRRALGEEARIGWAVEQPYAEVVERVAPVDVVFPFATRRWRKRLLSLGTRDEVFARVEGLRAFARSGTSIDFQGLLKSAILGWVGGATRRYGFAREAIRERAALLFINSPVSVDRSLHVIEWNMQLARAVAAGVPATPPAPDYSGFVADAPGLRPYRRRVVFLPGAGRPSKMWPVESFRDLARRLSSRRERPLLVWGPGEEARARAIAESGQADVAPRTDLRELAYLLREALLVVGGDTGPLHLAAAVGAPVIGLYGPTNPARNGPHGQLSRCLESFSTTARMDSIGVDEVMRRIEEILG